MVASSPFLCPSRLRRSLARSRETRFTLPNRRACSQANLIGSQLDKGEQVDFIFLDMSKAFDKVSHRKLLTLLQEQGFGRNLLAWFDFYLQNRLQRVTALGVSSETLSVTS